MLTIKDPLILPGSGSDFIYRVCINCDCSDYCGPLGLCPLCRKSMTIRKRYYQRRQRARLKAGGCAEPDMATTPERRAAMRRTRYRPPPAKRVDCPAVAAEIERRIAIYEQQAGQDGRGRIDFEVVELER